MKIKLSKKGLYSTLLILGICFLTSCDNLFAQGPNAPEAASFEPVDATDMVNLVTGDLSYVLPLLNVPSPEGGYPIALSYHAGIAMDQEASWVGLGWNINPGTINRNINGTPDDLAWMNYNEFFYDAGYTDNYYNFSIGAAFYQTVSVGVGLSWGSNQSLGGYVSAGVGLKGTPFQIGGHVGTNSIGINVGYGFNYNGNSYDNRVGIGINYNYDSGLSAGISLSDRAKQSTIGINFSSKGTSINGSIAGGSVGISNSVQTIDSGDYDYGIGTNGFAFDTGVFNIGLVKTSVKISLFKLDDIYTSGILYPYSTLIKKVFTEEIEENRFMDVNTLQKFGENNLHEDLIDGTKENNRNNLTLPSYDNYIVSAQGISGSLSPYLFKELNLTSRGREVDNNDNEYVSYYNNMQDHPINSDRLNFTFSNAYNSFLRFSRTNIFNNGSLSSDGSNLLNVFNTNNDNLYSTIGTNANNKKREGNMIRTFTNEEIKNSYLYPGAQISNISGFVNARQGNNILNRADNKVFLDKSIGAYQITTLDGKTYHYSLPVHQFESFYKNFRNAEYNSAGENENFLEIQKTTPYATHWLLTAITGPDYIDVNLNGKLDEDDYGYWVEFNYGKWSDGYIWQTPNGRNEEIIDKDDPTKKTYAYSWGRKEIYYLDAIKTRTHTALFVKEVRQDNKSVVGNEKNVNLVSNKYTKLKLYAPIYFRQVSGVYQYDPYTINFSSSCPGQNPRGKEAIYREVAPATNYLLKLKKIILIKNENIGPNNLNSIGTGLIAPQQLTIRDSPYYADLKFDGCGGLMSYGIWGGDGTNWNSANTGVWTLFKKKPIPRIYDLHQQQNVLDIKDIEGLNLEAKALKIIDFSQNYDLAKNSPNAPRGRLTLESVNIKGKGGVALIPPYKFSYANPTTSFNKVNIDDWGFHKDNPQVWSLNQIQMPTGGKINMTYESDSYYAEAASYETLTFDNINMSSPNYEVGITFNNGTNLNNYFKVGREVSLSFTRKTKNIFGQIIETKEFDTKLSVASISGNTLWLYRLLNITEGLPSGNFTLQCNNNPGGICYSNIKIKNNKYPYYTDSDFNGKMGGGIRVKNITISNEGNNIATTEYLYTNSVTNKISGITSYAPSKVEKGIPYASELPSPMVMYGEVSMITKDGFGVHLGKTVFEFEMLEPQKFEIGYLYSLGNSFKVKENQNQSFSNNQVDVNKFIIENRLGNLGRMKSIKSLNVLNQLLTNKVNLFKQNLDSDGEIGVNQETYKSYKVVRKDNISKYYVNSTSRVNYPSVLESTTNTQGGFTNTTNFAKHDFLTGQVLETTTTDSKGNEFKTELIPAYTKYGTGNYSMGSKVDNPSNYNMLTQEAMTKTYIKVGGNWKETGVGITTWNNDWGYTDFAGTLTQETATNKKIWRKHKNFVWDGSLNSDGTLNGFTDPNPEYDDEDFKWGLGIAQTNTKWKNVSTTTQYNHYSMPLEVKDINGNFAAVKTGDKESKIFVTANAPYNTMFYSGAEDNDGFGQFSGAVHIGNGTESSTAHTGFKGVTVNSGQKTFVVKPKVAGKYKASVWAHRYAGSGINTRLSVNGVLISPKEVIYAGYWIQLNFYPELVNSTSEVYITSSSGSTFVDDFRVHPIASSMTSYVYNEWDELWCIISNNGLASKFEYDVAGRLLKTYTEVVDFDNGTTSVGTGGFKQVSENEYHYKN